MENQFRDACDLLGRVLIAALFLGGAAQKANDPAPVMTLLAGVGLPSLLVWPALVLNAVIGVALIIGVQVRGVAFVAALYCIFTSWFHYWPNDPWQMTIFIKNWAIAGGCLILSTHGARAWALQPNR